MPEYDKRLGRVIFMIGMQMRAGEKNMTAGANHAGLAPTNSTPAFISRLFIHQPIKKNKIKKKIHQPKTTIACTTLENHPQL